MRKIYYELGDPSISKGSAFHFDMGVSREGNAVVVVVAAAAAAAATAAGTLQIWPLSAERCVNHGNPRSEWCVYARLCFWF